MMDPLKWTPEPNDPPAPGGRIGVRFTLVHTLAFVLAAAMASALWVEFYRINGGPSSDAQAFDFATLVVLALTLTGVAVGCCRGSTVLQILLQITASCGIVLVMFVAIEHNLRIARYWAQIIFGLTVTLPVVALRTSERLRWPGWIRGSFRSTVHVALCSFINLSLVLVGAIVQVYFAEWWMFRIWD